MGAKGREGKESREILHFMSCWQQFGPDLRKLMSRVPPLCSTDKFYDVASKSIGPQQPRNRRTLIQSINWLMNFCILYDVDNW